MTAGTGSIRREVFIEAPQATVFAFFPDPDKMSRWMGVSHALDARQGGSVPGGAPMSGGGQFMQPAPALGTIRKLVSESYICERVIGEG